MKMKPLTKCPTCFKEFDLRGVSFRCLNPKCKCPDPVLRKFLGGNRDADMGSVISMDDSGWQSPDRATCGLCGSETSMRICPVNHCELPKFIGEIPDIPVYMVGPGQSGKSVYLAVTIKHLRRQVYPSFGSTLDFSTQATEKKVERVEQVIRGLELFPGNRGWGNEPELRQPFMLFSRIHSPVPYLYPLRRLRCANMVLFDTAGEDNKDEAAMGLCYDGFEHAAALIVFIDPRGICQRRGECG